MVTDPVGDMIIQLKNAGMTGNKIVELPYSRMKHEVALILAKERYVGVVKELPGKRGGKILHIALRYLGNSSAITNVKRISKPGLRLYVKKTEIPSVVGGMGIAVLSTPKGIMSGKDAKKQGIGGEILCEIW